MMHSRDSREYFYYSRLIVLLNQQHARNMVLPDIQVCFRNVFVNEKHVFVCLALKIFKGGEVAEDYNGPREAGKSRKRINSLEKLAFFRWNRRYYAIKSWSSLSCP